MGALTRGHLVFTKRDGVQPHRQIILTTIETFAVRHGPNAVETEVYNGTNNQ